MSENKYDIDMWENVLNDLPDSYKKWFKEEKIYLNKNIKKGASVLEVGCGEGRSLNDLLPVTKNLTGIEHDKKAVESTKAKFAKHKNVKILLAEANNLPFKDKSFDYVICMTTFANFGEDKFRILSEIKRVLKNDGEIVISVFSEDAFEERMKLYKKVGFPMKKIIGTSVYYESDCDIGVSEQFSEKQLRDIFKEAKLYVVDLKKLEISYIIKLKKVKHD